MARKQKAAPKEDIEQIMIDSIERIGVKNMKQESAQLLIRLFVSGIARYFFEQPDNVVNVGYLQFNKSPEKDELFKVNIIKNEEEGIENADKLWRYYTGELTSQRQLKKVLDNFVTELIDYSQNQELEIMKITGKLNK